VIDLLDAQNASLNADQSAANAIYDFLITIMNQQRATGLYNFLLPISERQEIKRKLENYIASGGPA
jgi:outer membrane protein TolC